MREDVLLNVLGIMSDADQSYVRVIREFATVRNQPGTRGLAESYIGDIRNTAYEAVALYIASERIKLTGAEIERDRDMAAELRRNNELMLMKLAVDGADNQKLIEIVTKYSESEYLEDFKIIIQPRIRELMVDEGDLETRMNNKRLAAAVVEIIDNIPDDVKADVNYLDELQVGVRSILYFNTYNYPMSVKATPSGHILNGNCILRNIKNDLDCASEEFNPLNEQIEPIIKTESIGGRSVAKTFKYKYKWDI